MHIHEHILAGKDPILAVIGDGDKYVLYDRKEEVGIFGVDYETMNFG